MAYMKDNKTTTTRTLEQRIEHLERKVEKNENRSLVALRAAIELAKRMGVTELSGVPLK